MATVCCKLHKRLSESCRTDTERKAAKKIAGIIGKVLDIGTNDTAVRSAIGKRRAKRVFSALGVKANRHEGVRQAIQACALRSSQWQRTVAQLIVDMVGQGDDIRHKFQNECFDFKLDPPISSRLAPSLVQADEERRRAEQRRIEALELMSRVGCEKCGAPRAVTVRLCKQGKKGGAGGKAVDVAHYQCTVCRKAWSDANE